MAVEMALKFTISYRAILNDQDEEEFPQNFGQNFKIPTICFWLNH